MTQRIALSQLGILRNGINYNKSSVINGCKIIGVADFGNKVFPDYKILQEIDSAIVSDDDLLQEGDILFVRSNGNKNLVGRSMFIRNLSESVCYSGFCISLRPNPNIILPEYLFYALRAPFCRKQYSYSQQTNITNLSQAVLGAVVVPVPDYETQMRNAKILYDIDKKIENNNLICSELEAMAKTLYDYWFVQFDFPDENGKPYCTSGGRMVWNEKLKREIPEGWNVVPLGNILELLKDGTHNPPKRQSSGIPLLTGTMFGKIVLSYNGVTYITQDDYNTIHRNYAPRKNDFIMTKIGSVGNVNILREIDIPLAIHCNSALIRFQKHIPISYAYFMLKSTMFQAYLKKEVSKTVQEFVSLERLAGIQVCLPNSKTLNQFASIVEKNFEKMMLCEIENCELSKLRDWLLPMLMNGQARVE